MRCLQSRANTASMSAMQCARESFGFKTTLKRKIQSSEGTPVNIKEEVLRHHKRNLGAQKIGCVDMFDATQTGMGVKSEICV